MSPRLAVVALLVALVTPSTALGQTRRPESSWEIGIHGGALWIEDDFAAGHASSTRPVVAATATWRPDPRVSLEVEAWRRATGSRAFPDADGEPAAAELEVWGAALSLGVSPLAGERAVDPHLSFGVETVRAGDDEDRSAAFVSGAGLRSRLGGRWILRLDLRNHFLTIEEPEVDGVETGRDASLWEIRAGVGVRLGDAR